MKIAGISISGLRARLLVPFAAIFGGAIIIIGAISLNTTRNDLRTMLQKKAEILVRNLATVLADPFSTGEYDRMQKIVDSAKTVDSDVAYATVVGIDGRGIASTDSSLRNVTLTRDDFEKDALKAEDFLLRPSPTPHVFEVAMPVRFQQNKMGVIRIGVSTDSVRAMVQRSLMSYVFIGLLAMFLGLAVYAFTAERVAGPVSATVLRLEELARGAGDLTVRLPVNSDDEIGRLAQAFNRFLEGLGGLIGQVRGSSDQVATSSKALSEITQQSSGNITQAVQVMTQISQSMGQVAQATQSVAASVQEAGLSAQRGGKLATDVVGKMKQAQESVSSAAGFIHELGKRSSQIGNIVDLITKIADQTNLLSLNAAIEAARAGESGRGFAVVAEEIRKLAESSAESAQQITALIREVQDETTRAIETTEKGNREVAEGYRIILEAEKLFSSISTEVNQVNTQVSAMASNTQQVAASTEEATASSEELSAAIEQVSTNSGELAQIVQRLRGLVGQFKVS